MRVGYLGDIFISYKNKDIVKYASCLTEEAVNQKLNYLILCGGISLNYNETLDFISLIKKYLSNNGVKFRFIPGNTDFYYKVPVVDKKNKFNEIRDLYLSHQNCLITHPILTSSVRIIGTESWYDYSFYKGSPISLKNIVKKSRLFGLVKNKDVVYITDSNDSLKLSSTFDYKYSNLCKDSLVNTLKDYEKKYMKPVHSVIVGYFYPLPVFLPKGIFSGYFGTFKGSNLEKILNQFYITEYVFGLSSSVVNDFFYNNIRFINPKKDIFVRDYDI